MLAVYKIVYWSGMMLQVINQNLVQKILQWHHTGFNVHSKVRTESKEETERMG